MEIKEHFYDIDKIIFLILNLVIGQFTLRLNITELNELFREYNLFVMLFVCKTETKHASMAFS